MPDYTILPILCWSCEELFVLATEMQNHHLDCHERTLARYTVTDLVERAAPEEAVALPIPEPLCQCGCSMWDHNAIWNDLRSFACLTCDCRVFTLALPQASQEVPPEAPCELCQHRWPGCMVCSRCGADCAPCAAVIAALPEPELPQRHMWRVGVEGDLYHRHPENVMCARTGCVPVEASMAVRRSIEDVAMAHGFPPVPEHIQKENVHAEVDL